MSEDLSECPSELPYYVLVSSEGSCESAGMRRLTRAFTARLSDKYKKYPLQNISYEFIN